MESTENIDPVRRVGTFRDPFDEVTPIETLFEMKNFKE